MLKRIFLASLLGCFVISNLYAAQSTITEAEGYSCMGYDKSRKQTEEEALANAKRKAMEYASTYIKSETRVKDFQLEKDLIEAYANATVKLIQESDRAWYKDAAMGDCFKVKIKAEVIPDEQAMEKVAKGKGLVDDPSAPINIQIWTDKKEYRESEKIKIYIQGNKPFYARVLHKGVGGEVLQLLPNPYRLDHYFNGGVIYEVPSGEDKFEIEVSPPFGQEVITVLASTTPLGEINLQPVGGLYQVKTSAKDIGDRTRGVKIKKKVEGQDVGAAEFYEGKVVILTKQ